MAMNTLGDLNNHLFEQMERLNDDEYMENNLETEIKRARAVKDISQQIIHNGRLVLEAEKFVDDRVDVSRDTIPNMLE